jgi:pyruvate,water dikinase
MAGRWCSDQADHVSRDVVIPLERLDPGATATAGGKACALAALAQAGLPVPAGAAVTTAAYTQYIAAAGLRERIALELSRKDFADMRWEEIWDAALRIRNLFLTTPLPRRLRDRLAGGLGERLAAVPVVVRSSAPGEDAEGASFAGLHESYVNIRGLDAVLEHVRLVWASLWSDAALLYRRELGLDTRRSAMAVVVQELADGRRSGVCFTVDPRDASHGLLEAVHGLNQGLVDGTIEPDRWVLERDGGRLLEHAAAEREQWVRPTADGVRAVPLPAELRGRPPLSDEEAGTVYGMARRSESFFGRPQDVEWTFAGERLTCLQSRPITTGAEAGDDRAAYLSLRRSFDNLATLRRRIEDELLPQVGRDADAMAGVLLETLADDELYDEILRRRKRYEHWIAVYSVDFIPFAHGVRLFGRLYNDVVHPADPYEFTDLLGSGPMASMQRNDELESMAARLRDGEDIEDALAAFLASYGDTSWGATTLAAQRETLRHLIGEMAAAGTHGRESQRHDPAREERDTADTNTPEEREERFLQQVDESEREHAREVLDLARASWRLRDDDNVYVGRIEGQLLRAVAEARRRDTFAAAELDRLAAPLHPTVGGLPGPSAAAVAGAGAAARPGASAATGQGANETEPRAVRARQLLGQPAGPGVAVGPARVVVTPEDISGFRAGEVLVCDAVDPSMTFVVPLAAAIVERRGGMLIHGAIIAREYGIPCVTGVPQATQQIDTGDRVSVDGHLGIVVVG